MEVKPTRIRRPASVQSASSQDCGFTLIEMLAVLAIIVILAALLFPVVSSMKKRGDLADLASRMRQIGAAMAMAQSEGPYEREPGMFPYTVKPGNGTWVTWYDALAPYLGMTVNAGKKIPADVANRGVFWHRLSSYPASGIDPISNISFSYNYVALGGPNLSTDRPSNRLAGIAKLSEMIVVMPSNEDGVSDYLLNTIWPAAAPLETAPGRSVALFADGHVDSVDVELLKTPEGFARYLLGQ